MKKLLSTIMEYFQNFSENKIEDIEIKNVQMDTRKVEDGTLFFAINGGNRYVGEALEKGASLVIGDDIPAEFKENSRVIEVKDSVIAMQELGNLYRRALNLKVIGITGSNGKTTTKDLLHGILQEKYTTEKTQGNYNNHIGLPFTLLSLKESTEVAVLEMGMSGFGEIDALCKIAEPDCGIITNIGDSHLEFLKNRENVFKAKGEMIKYISPENLFVFGDDPFLESVDAIKVGFEKENTYVLSQVEESSEGAIFNLNGEKYRINLNGEHNCINSGLAIAVGEKFGLNKTQIQKGLLKSSLSAMRFEKIKRGNHLYINDAYNASPVSMRYSLETFSNLEKNGKRVAVLGDMLELGEDELQYHRAVVERALGLDIDEIYLYGPRMEKIYEMLDNSKLHFFKEKSQIAVELSKLDEAMVLLKGSRGMKLEEIIK